MEVESSYLPWLPHSLGFGILIIWVVWKYLGVAKSEDKDSKEDTDSTTETGNGDTKEARSKKSFKHNVKAVKKASTQSSFTHDLLLTSLKGHTGQVLGLDTSLNGKYLASCSDDRSVRLWSVKDFGAGNRSIRINVEFDHAQQARFSPDSRAFIAGLSVDNTVRVFRLAKKDDGAATATPLDADFPPYNKAKLLNIGVGASANGGSFVMTAYEDTTILIRDLKGEVLHTINTNQGNNNCACVSPCGRFVASSGWTPDVKVWAVNFSKSGDFSGVARAFELKGHTSSVWSFAFNLDSSRMISVSKDGTWRFYDTMVEYDKGQEPYLLSSGQFSVCGNCPADDACKVALSPDGMVAAVASFNNICVFSTTTGDVEVEFSKVHCEVITALTFDIGGRYILSAGDRHIRVLHNTMGYKEKIRSLEGALKSLPAASAIRDRQQKQLDDTRKSLQQIAHKS